MSHILNQNIYNLILFDKTDSEYIISFYDDKNSAPLPNTKRDRGRICIINDNHKIKEFILQKLKPLGLNSIPDIHILKMERGDIIKPHTDSIGDIKDQNFKTINILLSNDSDFKGGDLKVLGNSEPKELGYTTVYKRTDIHEITEIESGTRWGVVIFCKHSNFSVKNNLF